MPDITEMRATAVQNIIDVAVEQIAETGRIPTPDHIAGALLLHRKFAVSDNIGPLAETYVDLLEEALDFVLPRCTLTREQLEADM